MVEIRLNDVLECLTPKVYIANWLDTGDDQKILAQSIREFRKRSGIDQDRELPTHGIEKSFAIPDLKRFYEPLEDGCASFSGR